MWRALSAIEVACTAKSSEIYSILTISCQLRVVSVSCREIVAVCRSVGIVRVVTSELLLFCRDDDWGIVSKGAQVHMVGERYTGIYRNSLPKVPKGIATPIINSIFLMFRAMISEPTGTLGLMRRARPQTKNNSQTRSRHKVGHS